MLAVELYSTVGAASSLFMMNVCSSADFISGSPYCQKASWNDSPHPHKAICQHWTFLMHAWPILAGPTGVLSDPDFAENSKRFKFVADRFLRALVIEKGYTEGFMAAVLLQCVSG